MGVLLGTFMGGMCLGSLLLPRVSAARGASASRVRRGSSSASAPSACCVLFGMPLVGGAYTAWAGGGVVGILLRGVAAAICLLPPTLLMGATLPAIARWVEATPRGRVVARVLLRRQHRRRRRRQPARRLLPAARLRHLDHDVRRGRAQRRSSPLLALLRRVALRRTSRRRSRDPARRSRAGARRASGLRRDRAVRADRALGAK